MDESPEIVLTNDDGIDAPGLRALFEALSAIGSVTVVAPNRNRSAVGRALSYGRTSTDDTTIDELTVDFSEGAFTSPVPHADHELGYAIDGTPCDCAIVGVNALEPDVLVSGCNAGANLGAYSLSRSGTVSAAMEAAFHDVPSIAVSMDTLGYESEDGELSAVDFERAAAIVASIVEEYPGTGLFDRIDYLNINVPRPDRPIESVEITRPTEVYEMDATMEDGTFQLTNRLWQQMANRDIPDPPDTDRYVLLEDGLSVSPLAVPHDAVDTEPVQAVLEDIVAV
ncbi:5'/3'-nucleotidase SurE [Natronobacterium gregoryi]|uniref:5'-nucleotidase SurE n=2 Tax=Natronobacterium gregoryi TaxID=44930 RepID=L0AG90_NATGS|nr:5'/3'-nucleotidase SurE [Natronobacterium gregoryi]AFZ72080.1 5'/3'-nucleotidase SurE [Natronobacterium gregoryi SP2]ELY62746.1 stationary-phase survival protein SurE [Natronobacterium gregoryi SP2]PLK20054.1 5'/3'-nucleotidase SurE [Natronobacterium gregoryi SP2]SFJ44343.1 5'-nucleotidase /3'-nucleotidase /exopolyphosphatase [Natronobacterium gregoryi]